MRILENIKPEKVMYFFEDICAIPHGSGDTKAISNYCVSFAAERGLRYHQDDSNNVIIWKNGSEGSENAEPVIIQGHLDMVCEKDENVKFDFTKDRLNLKVDGDYIMADGTTLGGDDGSAVAVMLALLDSDVKAPPIEAVFTVDEEVGMLGAAQLDMSLLKGKKMLNLDSEDEREFIVGCAGGIRITANIPLEYEEFYGIRCLLTVDGLVGGHSGMAPAVGIANASELMGRVLDELEKKAEFRIISVTGGTKDNVVPAKTTADIIVSENDFLSAMNLAADMTGIFKNEFAVADPGINVAIMAGDTEAMSATDKNSTAKIVSALLLVPGGLQAMSMEMPGLVQTSLNMGILKTENNCLVFSSAVRSAKPSQKTMLVRRITRLIKLLGGTVSTHGDYPAWEYKLQSDFRDMLVGLYREKFGFEPEVHAIHAGVECGIFYDKIEGFDCVSFGPNILDIHSSRERMSISSVQRIWEYVLAVLEKLA